MPENFLVTPTVRSGASWLINTIANYEAVRSAWMGTKYAGLLEG
ncbi:MAG TPA: hypothetical protein VMN57_15640 [Anaerolineales bacterium]|nr:hypothetical protein [Anaerolineales bacterium]